MGMVDGLLTVLFIYLWVNYEWRVDRFHAHGDDHYRLVSGDRSTHTILNTEKRLRLSIPDLTQL